MAYTRVASFVVRACAGDYSKRKKALLFATNNYLGLMHDERVISAAVEGVEKWGIGNGSVRLLTGNIEMHQHLEEKIAKFKHREAGITFVSGCMANSGSISAVVNAFKPSITGFLNGKIEKDEIRKENF